MVRRVVQPRLRSLARVASVLAAALAAGCGDFKGATPTGGGDGGAAGDTGTTFDPLVNGPGIHGALPSGYCCAKDDECRDRSCVLTPSGSKMCLDHCRSQSTCRRRELTFTCDSQNLGDDGLCQPPSGFVCIPAAQFRRGSRAPGECCTATGDGNAGEECEGNKCIAINKNDQDNPFVCTHRCESTKDCPSGTVCGPLGTCDPGNLPYTCK